METIFDMVDPDIVESAEEFIRQLKDNTIHRICLKQDEEGGGD